MKDLVKKTQFENDVPFWILNAIVDELKRAEQKHPNWPTDIIHAAAVVGEESGELIQASLQQRYEGGSTFNCTNEAVQVAAMAIRFLKNKYSEP